MEVEVNEQPRKQALKPEMPLEGAGIELLAAPTNGPQQPVQDLSHAANSDSDQVPANRSDPDPDHERDKQVGDREENCIEGGETQEKQLDGAHDVSALGLHALEAEGNARETNGEGNGGGAAHEHHVAAKVLEGGDEQQEPSQGAAANPTPEVAAAGAEAGATTFECPAEDCGGSIVLNDHLCRFGHGLMVRCTGRRRHKFRWCNEQYSFVPANEWLVHLSWCYKGAKAQVACVSATQLQHFAAKSASQTVAEEEQSAAAPAEHAGSKRKAEPENGKARTTRSSLDEKEALARGAVHVEEETDASVNEDMRGILQANRKAILCGDSARSRQWAKQLREHRNKTNLFELQARGSFSGDRSTGAAGVFDSVLRGDVDKLSSLIEEGEDVNVLDRNDYTPLHWAAAAGSVDVGRLLLDVGAEAGAVGEGGDRPVHVAAAQGRVGFLNLLLARGADLDTPNEAGMSARHLLNLLAESTPT